MAYISCETNLTTMKKLTCLLLCLLVGAYSYGQLSHQAIFTHKPVKNLHTLKMASNPELKTEDRALLFGFFLGATLFNDLPKSNDFYTFLPGYHLGVSMMYLLSAQMAFLTELMYLQKGYSYKNGSSKSHLRRNYLQLNLLMAIALTQSPLLQFQLGPTLGFWTCGRYVYRDPISGERQVYKEEFHTSSGATLQRFELGLMAGFMMHHQICGGMMSLGLRGMYGLTPYGKYDIGSEVNTYRNFGFLLTLGYALTLNRLMHGAAEK